MSIVVGRSPHVDASVPERSVSREHARFSLQDGVVLVEDTRSRNGVILRGKRVQRAAMQPDDHVTLGKVKVWFHQNLGAAAHSGGIVERYEDLRERTELELIRARDEKYHLSVIVVRSADPIREPASNFWLRIRAQLRSTDAVTAYSPEAILITIPAKSIPDCRRRVEGLLAAGDLLLCGVAESPACGQSFEALVAEAHTAALRASRTRRLVFAAGPAAPTSTSSGRVVAESTALRELLREIDRLAGVDVPVLVSGESGTGKEVLAERLHARGPRAGGPVCAINCAAIPRELIESTLFGHVRGAFTGADREAQGVFVQANGGTLLLDEVAELSPTAQASLLRVLETKLVRPIGSNKDVSVDVRIVSATNANLEARVAEGRFRADLFSESPQ